MGNTGIDQPTILFSNSHDVRIISSKKSHQEVDAKFEVYVRSHTFTIQNPFEDRVEGAVNFWVPASFDWSLVKLKFLQGSITH